MESFVKVPSVLKRFLVEMAACFLFPLTVLGIINEIRPGTFAEHHNLDGLWPWLFALIGPIPLVWLLDEIFRPRIKVEFWFLPPHNEIFDFCSTHPSYVLIDLMNIAFAGLFVWIGMLSGSEIPAFRITLAIAIFIPVARLTAWYVLGLKIDDPETDDAYLPVLWTFSIFLLIVGGIAIGVNFS